MLWFKFKRMVKMGAKSLWLHRLRSTLTALGIIFGVASVIAMLAIGEGASREAQAQIARLGSSNIIVKTVKPSEEKTSNSQESSMLEYGLRYEDAQRFQETLPHAEVIVPERILDKEVRFKNRKVTVKIIGTVPWYPKISPIQLREGRFISELDMNYQQGVCIVDELVAQDLFAFDDRLGQDIKIGGDYYKVVGVVGAVSLDKERLVGAETSAESAGGAVGVVYIPLTAVRSRFGDTVFQMTSGSRSAEKVELQQITIRVSSADQVLKTRDVLESLMSSSVRHKKKDYQIVVPLELLRQAQHTKRIFSIVLGSIAAISLLVGGIGIMNIMLATVSERTREIGIRRALGARRSDIIMQFLSETVLLTLAGGLLGIVVGMVIPLLVSHFGNMPTAITPISLVLAFGISAAVGVTFGLYPAYRAAHLDPIESLRHE